MHRFRDEWLSAAMVQFSLPPIVLLLELEPCRRHEFAAKGVPAAFENLDHGERVIALLGFDPKPRPDALQEWLGARSGRTPPGPATPRIATRVRARHDPAAPERMKPFEHNAFPVYRDDRYRVRVFASRGYKSSRYCDAAFAVHERGCVGPISVKELSHGARRSAAAPARDPDPAGRLPAAAQPIRSRFAGARGRRRPAAGRRSPARTSGASP